MAKRVGAKKAHQMMDDVKKHVSQQAKKESKDKS